LQTFILLFSFSCRRWYTCAVPSRGPAHVAETAAREQPEPAEPHRRTTDTGAGSSLPGRRRTGVRRRPGDRRELVRRARKLEAAEAEVARHLGTRNGRSA